MGTNNQFTWGLWSIIDILSVFFLFKYPTINIRVVQEKLFDINITVVFYVSWVSVAYILVRLN